MRARLECKLYAVRIFVRDWERACDFYENVVGLEPRFKEARLGWAEFDVGGPSLGIDRVAPDDGEGGALCGRFLGVSLQVPDIDAVYERLRAAGVRFDAPPEVQPWGGTLAHFRDPEGNVLTLLG